MASVTATGVAGYLAIVKVGRDPKKLGTPVLDKTKTSIK